MNGFANVVVCVVLAVVVCVLWCVPARAATLGEVQAALKELQATVERAKAAGVQTLQAEIPLMLQTRFEADWNDPKRAEVRADWADFYLRNTKTETEYLQGVLNGKGDARKVPDYPDYAKLVKKDNYFLLDGKPVLIVTTRNSGGEKGDDRYANPNAIYGIVSAVGATRYDYQNTPIWEVYQKDPKSHRVYDGGWCGHIIKDKWSIGGQGGRAGICVISLDYPPMLEAVKKSVIAKAQRFKASARAKTARMISMDWEFTYQNYDEPTKVKFQNWLKERYKTIADLNKVWKTDLKDFEEVTLPDVNWGREQNPAKYYDFSEFNLWRLTDYFVWAHKVIAAEVPGYPITTGGGSPFSQNFAKDAVDEEAMMLSGAVDVFLSETGSRSWGTAVVFDLQRSMFPKAMIHDPEYHSTGGYMPMMFLHGCSSLDFYNWNSKGVNLSLPDGYATLRGCLEVRRLAEEITRFPADVPQAAILYSRASLIQRHPGAFKKEGRTGVQSPYVLEVEKCYRAGTILDTPMGFVTSRQATLGIRNDLKVLILPCMYFANEDVVKAVVNYAKAGGTVVVTPTSLVADEYNRRRDYLETLGISIEKEIVPKYLARKAQPGVAMPGSEYDFIQGPIAPTVVEDEPTATLTWKAAGAAPGKTLDGKGIRQEIKVTGPSTLLAAYPDGGAAVISKKLGRGEVIYLAMALDEPSLADFFDWVYERVGIKRFLRATDPAGKRIPGLESRTVADAGGYLTYVYNMSLLNRSMKVKLDPKVNVRRAENLNLARTQDVKEPFDLGPYEFFIFRLSR